jgi:membrane dipeptidase
MRVDSPADRPGEKIRASSVSFWASKLGDSFEARRRRLFRGLGQRVSQLTYNSGNLIRNVLPSERCEGISDFGVAIIEKMNKVGMAVDVSHCGDRTRSTLSRSRKSRADHTFKLPSSLAGIPRIKADEAIKKVGETGSVMG